MCARLNHRKILSNRDLLTHLLNHPLFQVRFWSNTFWSSDFLINMQWQIFTPNHDLVWIEISYFAWITNFIFLTSLYSNYLNVYNYGYSPCEFLAAGSNWFFLRTCSRIWRHKKLISLLDSLSGQPVQCNTAAARHTPIQKCIRLLFFLLLYDVTKAVAWSSCSIFLSYFKGGQYEHDIECIIDAFREADGK